MKKEYQIFLEQMLEHGDATKAYMKAYPKAKEESARVKSYNLLQNVTIKKELDAANKKRQEAIETARLEQDTNAAKLGINTKNDRVLNLLKLITEIQADIDKGTTVDYFVISNKVQKVVKEIPVKDLALMRVKIKDIQAEISKIEGDYAPEQSKGEMILTWQENKTYQKK